VVVAEEALCLRALATLSVLRTTSPSLSQVDFVVDCLLSRAKLAQLRRKNTVLFACLDCLSTFLKHRTASMG
jgi:hypothetical protein